MRVIHTNNTLKDYCSLWRMLLPLFLIILASPLRAAQVTITLTDNATGLVAPDTQIFAYRIQEDGSRKQVTRQNTDANGQLLVELDDIENGTRYQFKTRAFNSTDLYSEVISNVTEFNFTVGSKLIVLKNGADASHPALANHQVDVKTPKEDGKLRWVTRATSDENGIVRFNLSDTSVEYVFTARSTLTNQEKRSELSSATGEQEFVVGNLPLNVSLVHGITNTPISGQRIDVRRLDADGSKSWAGRRDTDEAGNAVFDLEGLGDGSVFELYTRNSNGFFATILVSQPGAEQFPLGNARVLILNGREETQPPHIEKQVTVFKQTGESREKVLSVKTDANGQILLDLKELATGAEYIARLKHENKHYEAQITGAGDSSAVFGRLPQIISATVFNTATNAPAVGERVDLLRWDGDKKRHAGRADTNENGYVEFDAQGLYENQVYLLRIKPFDGSHLESDNLSEAGSVNFNVHLLEDGFQVQVLDGTEAETSAIANQRVDVFRVEDDSLKHYTRRDTDGSGMVAFTLPDFDKGQQYVLQTRHTENNKNIRSAPFSNNGSHVFTVGTTPLSVTLLNPVSNEPMENARIDVMRTREDGKNHREARLTTDENGLAIFHITQISESSPATLRSWSEEGFYAEQQVTSNGNHNFVFGNTQVTLRNGRDENQALLDNHRVSISKYVGGKRSNVFNRNTSDDGIALMQLDTLSGEDYYEAEVTIGGDKYRETFTSPGEVQLTFGNHEEDVQVALLDGTSEQPTPIPGQVIAIHRMDNDKLRWVSNKETDEEGEARLALPGLSQGQSFVLKAKHPISGKWFESEVINQDNLANQEFDFVVGIEPMIITLLNPVTNEPIADARVDVRREREDGSWHREARDDTDENGQVTFHITEVSDARPVKLEAWTENSFYGQKIVTASGEHDFELGNTQITIRNGRVEGAPLLTDTRLRVYRHTADDRHREFDRPTSAQGIALMALDPIEDGEFYRAEVYVEGDKFIQDFTNMGAVDLTFGDLTEDTRVTLLDGTQAQPTPLVDWGISIHEVTPERPVWITNKGTDENGQAKLPLQGLKEGKQFVLKAQHAVTGKWFESEVISSNSDFTFVVGAPALVINLTHPGNGTPMVNTRIEVFREDEDPDNWRREAREETDENGQVTFYLKDISASDPIELRMRSEEGFWASTPLTSTGTHNLPFGNVPVTVINKEDNLPIANKRLEAFWMDDDNELHREARYNTTENGEVLLELDRLVDGTRYALRVHNPFGENKRYYGPIVYREGAIEFLVAKGEQTELDLIDPEVFITSPTRDNVNGLGFLLGGVARDNNSISRIEVSVSDPVKGTSHGEAVLLNNGQWQFSIGESAITLDETITVTATAYDLALNSALYSKSFKVVEDMEPPAISIVSHEDNDDVNETGFTVIGDASDDTGVVTVTATLTDPVLGTTIEEQTVSVAEDGQWALIVTNGKVSGGQTAQLSFTATDSSEKTTDIGINLIVQTIVPQQQQLISRITFGMTPDLYINQPDATTFMTQQLDPASVDDSELEAEIAAMEIMELSDLRARQLHYMLYSQRQLNEVMTWFWDNHFNTNFNAHENVAFEMAENDGFRQNALGNFRDLLAISAKSPAMIYYLNNAQNVVGRPNENYAREIMELSTMGVDGGYTAQDISELARIFTGWHEQEGAFFFNAEQHDFDTKNFLGATIQGEGLAEGEQALDILASHPSTARNICRKLIALFVSDQPVTTLQGQCEGQFLASGGDIASVVQVILSSNEFVSLEHQGNKIKTPVEMILAAIRSVNATPDYDQINDTLSRLAYSLFTYPVPTGLAETGPSWISSNALLERIRFANKFALEGEAGASADLMALLMAMGYSSADAIVGVLADLTLNGRLTELERDIATALLNENIAEGESFSMQSPDAEQKLQRLLGTMLSYPAFQYQ